MPEERRLGPRKRLALEVMINQSDQGLQRCQTRDISLEGVFIEADQLALRKNAVVDVVLKLPGSGRKRHYRIQARVATIRNRGARLLFRNLDEPAYTALVDLLYPAE
jgi:hypothetical protein